MDHANATKSVTNRKTKSGLSRDKTFSWWSKHTDALFDKYG